MDITALRSKSVGDLQVYLVNPAGEKYEVTKAVTLLRLSESINKYSLHGYLVMYDTMDLKQVVPLVGQETVLISFTKEDTEYKLKMYVTSIEDEYKAGKLPVLNMYLASELEMLNNSSVFSRAYKGLASEIINNIHKDILLQNITTVENSQNSINYIVPYKKPYEAFDDILQSSYSISNNPMFLYQTLDGNGSVHLKSLDAMRNSAPVYKFAQNPVTKDKDHQQASSGYQSIQNERNLNMIFNYKAVDSFDVHQNIRYGVYGSFTTAYDISSKTYQQINFKYRTARTKTDKNDYFNLDYKINSVSVADNHKARHNTRRMNGMAYSNLYNLGSYPAEITSIRQSVYNDRSTICLLVNLNSRPGIAVGKTIDVDLDSNNPVIDNINTEYKQLSGKYIIADLDHNITNEEYSMSAVLIRDRIE